MQNGNHQPTSLAISDNISGREHSAMGHIGDIQSGFEGSYRKLYGALVKSWCIPRAPNVIC
jgi:hypothetical protein